MTGPSPHDAATAFEQERRRLTGLAAHILGDDAEGQDVVQLAWLRLHRAVERGDHPENLGGWLTTVTTRLCLDRLRQRVPEPLPEADLPSEGRDPEHDGDPLHDVVLAEAVGTALHVVLDRLSPRERVAFVLHDTFAVEFESIAALLDTTPTAARKLASRARAKVGDPAPPAAPADRPEVGPADWEVVDAFLAAARGGDLPRLLTLLAPDVRVTADAAAALAGTPTLIEGRDQVAAFFDGAARAALPVLVGERPGLAWMQHGRARVVFDLTVRDGVVVALVFRAEPEALASVRRRSGASARE